ncbi:hypothetical protein AOB60_41830 [Streptomyces noursei]|uniref:Uncharacterized protein n=1 Tax=Streptomyces noursei TaxID=1971 RepID=A0A2N8P6F4_STRNR|nr:hypothetical protein [Streptomyces noursei]PNE36591.1 hypothetical protein AOB60_41830 [Streptomyces noursei]
MGTIITVTVTVISIAIVAGMFLIHRLNAQHDERIAASPFSDALPGSGLRSRTSKRPTEPVEPPVANRHEPHAGGRG